MEQQLRLYKKKSHNFPEVFMMKKNSIAVTGQSVDNYQDAISAETIFDESGCCGETGFSTEIDKLSGGATVRMPRIRRNAVECQYNTGSDAPPGTENSRDSGQGYNDSVFFNVTTDSTASDFAHSPNGLQFAQVDNPSMTAAEVPIVPKNNDQPVNGQVGPHALSVPNDPLYSQQWHLNTTYGINVSAVWDDYTGQGITVAVYDQGIDATHPDLAGNFDATHSVNASDLSPGGTPQTADDNHGTAVAGIIAADGNNGIGVTGIAYDSTLIGIYDHFGAGSTEQYITHGYQHIRDYADIENNSWGYNGVMSDNFHSTTFAPVAVALADAVSNGRDGLGCVVIQAAGNARGSNDNVNLHNFQNSRFITTVAATNADGTVTSYSTPGAAILVAAPGSPTSGTIVTTDRAGSDGYTTGDYTYSFNGTSAATPMISGVAALMLQANPNLGYRDVQEILACSARTTPGTATSFQYNGSTHWNGGGMHFSHDVGAGLVDALAAVRLAETWQGQGTAANEQSIIMSASPGLAINDNSTVTSTLSVANSLNIDHVEVDLNITHTYIGDLRITLTSPNGTVSTLFNRAGGSQDNIVFNMSSTQYWGETGTGNWTLAVSDMAGADVGVLNSWTLRLFGDTITNDDVYIYTNEFGTISNNLAARQVLGDSNGGIDTVNAAAVSTGSQIYLDGSGTSSIAGRTLTITAGTIENAFGGDGNDHIVGNSLNNRLEGWRGDDTLSGGAGNDMLYGGTGNDSLYGEAGVDFLYGGAGNDLLSGGAGNDIMDGGTGDDIYFIGSTGDVVYEAANAGIDTVNLFTLTSYTLGSNIEKLNVQNTAGVSVYGNELDNIIWGNTGNDIFYGYGGSDSLNGGAGNDYIYGGEGNDSMYGGAGNDYLSGGGGNDYMNGGAGDDIYFVANVGDVVYEAYGAGIDTVNLFTLTSYTLGSNVEKLNIQNTAGASVSGNGLSNSIWGNAGNDTLLGYGGNDYLGGGAGNDNLSGGTGNDTMFGGAGNDYLYGGAGVDTYGFQGAFGRDTIGVATNNNMDIIDFSAFTSTSASVSIGGNGGDDLIVTIGTNRLTITNWDLGGGYQLNTFIFSDGTKSTNGSGWL
jgi:subtilisin-like proprotein convertase family protein